MGWRAIGLSRRTYQALLARIKLIEWPHGLPGYAHASLEVMGTLGVKIDTNTIGAWEGLRTRPTSTIPFALQTNGSLGVEGVYTMLSTF